MIGIQHTIFGGTVTTGDVIQKVTHLLETDESTRDSYAELIGRYWLEFDGLDAVLPIEYHEAFLTWLYQATSWKTIQNRCMEIQRQRPDLDARPAIRRIRDAMSKQGVVR